jgi:hypothetical protein
MRSGIRSGTLTRSAEWCLGWSLRFASFGYRNGASSRSTPRETLKYLLAIHCCLFCSDTRPRTAAGEYTAVDPVVQTMTLDREAVLAAHRSRPIRTLQPVHCVADHREAAGRFQQPRPVSLSPAPSPSRVARRRGAICLSRSRKPRAASSLLRAHEHRHKQPGEAVSRAETRSNPPYIEVQRRPSPIGTMACVGGTGVGAEESAGTCGITLEGRPDVCTHGIAAWECAQNLSAASRWIVGARRPVDPVHSWNLGEVGPPVFGHELSHPREKPYNAGHILRRHI